jgi:hypothetical protein
LKPTDPICVSHRKQGRKSYLCNHPEQRRPLEGSHEAADLEEGLQ